MARAKRTEAPVEQPETGTALALPDTPALVAAFNAPEQMEAILTRIETEVRAVAPDLSTATSRKAIASLAFKVARSKTALDEVGKAITEDARKQIDAVNAKRRDVRERLEALQKEARKPLDDWEAAEATRVADLEDRLRDFTDDLPTGDAASERIAAVLDEIRAIPVDATWQEFGPRAENAKQAAIDLLTERLAVAQQREADQAELARLRRDAAEREAAEQRRLAEERRKAEAERLEREKAEAAARAVREAEARAKAEAERAKIEAERALREAEARAKAEAERVARETAEREAALQRQLAEAKAREEAAAARERERIAAEQARADAERRAREADQARRAEVHKAICKALDTAGVTHAYDPLRAVADEIMAGRIPHVKVDI